MAPDQPPAPGRVARREFEYVRHGGCTFAPGQAQPWLVSAETKSKRSGRPQLAPC
jgi:hypothetical protein